jgi:hypothetical protein
MAIVTLRQSSIYRNKAPANARRYPDLPDGVPEAMELSAGSFAVFMPHDVWQGATNEHGFMQSSWGGNWCCYPRGDNTSVTPTKRDHRSRLCAARPPAAAWCAYTPYRG